MRHRRAGAAAAVALWTLAALPVLAQEGASDAVEPAALRSCVETAQAQGRPADGCVTQAHRPCLQHSVEMPAVIALCFVRARETWDREIAARMAVLSEDAPDRLAALAGIEVKYDLLSGLLQCDRQKELALLAEAEEDRILMQTTGCAATATALAYVRLLQRLSKD